MSQKNTVEHFVKYRTEKHKDEQNRASVSGQLKGAAKGRGLWPSEGRNSATGASIRAANLDFPLSGQLVRCG
ncbi:Hypothetical protein NTJ_11847 [Nesidiocoris tenuis]|uniref:Uncharacterized protein n=1 Tax=Nesidiocoris tenuis TaxID=355587 RepID=A0ABN7B7A7_9HEMI|nr:Hypothetical protein NTJ_11847 [Nesidiocoris tenuis]